MVTYHILHPQFPSTARTNTHPRPHFATPILPLHTTTTATCTVKFSPPSTGDFEGCLFCQKSVFIGPFARRPRRYLFPVRAAAVALRTELRRRFPKLNYCRNKIVEPGFRPGNEAGTQSLSNIHKWYLFSCTVRVIAKRWDTGEICFLGARS